MSPRRYSMGRRDELAAATRQRIVESTLALHSQHGILGTSWKDIAQHADVSVGTVYRHFPSLDELLPACGALMLERYRPPRPEDAEAIAGSSRDSAGRLSSVVRAVYEFYVRAGAAAEIDPRERGLPAIQQWEAYWATTLHTFMATALASANPSPAALAFASSLLDQRTFSAMTARGIGADDAAAEVARMITAWLRLHDRQQEETT